MNDRESRGRGRLIVNADDWGRDCETTDRTRECIKRGAVSSVSGMMFMADSERAAAIAREHGVDTGLHLNFTTPFSTSGVPWKLMEHQSRIATFLLRRRLHQAIFHPGLITSFQYVVESQYAEFRRLYSTDPNRIDGHHHMHLCANVLMRKLMPSGVRVRRNFSFQKGEKGAWNRLYRFVVDRALLKRHVLTDFFFSLPPLEPQSRLKKIFTLATDHTVEVEAHPVRPDEYRFLAGGEIFRLAADCPVARCYGLPAGQGR